MRRLLRFIFDNYKQIGRALLFITACLAIVPIGIPSLFLIVCIGVLLTSVNILVYFWYCLHAYAYRESFPEWQGFLHT